MSSESDRELLELAAKAAGIKLNHWSNVANGFHIGLMNYWNPLEDDGDALRLAVALGLITGGSDLLKFETEEVLRGACKFTAMRRAIVRAAAEIGRGMP